MQPIIRVQDLSKLYYLGRSAAAYSTFREVVMDMARLPLRYLRRGQEQQTVWALKDVSFDNTSLQMPLHKSAAKYLMGLGQKGGYRSGEIDWKWDVARKHQDALWLGDVNAGLRVQLRAENYVRPMVNIHYPRQPLNDPPSWSGGGKGTT